MKKTFKRYLPYLKEHKLHYFYILIGILLTVTATAATAQIMQPLMDDMFIAKDEQMLYIIPLMLIGIYLLKSIGRYIAAIYMNYIGGHVITRLREDLLSKILHLDMEFLYTNRSGELISRITNDISRIQYFVSFMLPELLRESLTVVALLAYVIYLNATLAFYALVVLPVIIYPLILIAKRLRRLSHRSQEKNADMINRLSEVFNNSEIIKANSTQEYELERFSAENWRFFRINMKSVYTNELVSPLLEIVGAIGLAGVIFIGGQLVYDEKMSVGEFSAFLTAVGLLFQPIRRIGSIYGKIQDALAASQRVFELMDKKSTITEGEIELKDPIREISFESVSLLYQDSTVLKDINLNIQSPTTVALIGDSGGGKSSLVNLILRFYDADSGVVKINGKDIRTYSTSSLRSQIAMVSQRIYILQDTLAQNVAYAEEIDEERVIEALKLADAYEFAKSLSDGIYTTMDEAGTNLSGGQRQRIAIARAIYKNASLLILDEATSALDNESEERINRALKNYTSNMITITIAHRLSSIEESKCLYLFRAGEIVSSGSFKELLDGCGEFQKMAKGYS